MIAQLVRTKFESNLMSFCVFIGLIVAGASRYFLTREVPQGPVPREAMAVVAVWLLISCLGAGVVGLLRQTRERSGRLYAQLPVSARQVRVAYWLHLCLYPGLVAALLLAFVRYAGTEPPAGEMQLVAAILFFTMGVWLACLSLVTSNIARVIPERVRKNTVLYGFVVTVATLVLEYAVIFATVALLGGGGDSMDLPTAGLIIGLWCAALVALDIYLFSTTDRRLD